MDLEFVATIIKQVVNLSAFFNQAAIIKRMQERDCRHREKVNRGCKRGSRAFRKIRSRHQLPIFCLRAALDDQERQTCPPRQPFDRRANEEISELVLAGNTRDNEVDREFGSDIENGRSDITKRDPRANRNIIVLHFALKLRLSPIQGFVATPR